MSQVCAVSNLVGFGKVRRSSWKDSRSCKLNRVLHITFTVFIFLSFFILSGHRTAEASTVTIDVCQTLLKQVLIPATYQDIVTCNNDWRICAFLDPACCVPAVCNTLPHCVITQKVVAVAAHLEDKWVVECHPESFDPAAEWERWLRKQIPSLDDLLLPGAFEAAKLNIQAMKLAASPIPEKVKVQVLGIIQPFISAGTAKFTRTELDGSKIISNSDSNASLYLRDGYNAITLYDLIIINDSQYKILTNSIHHDYTVAEIISGSADAEYVDALMLLIHELVHVKQYSALGYDAFLTNYLIETISRGYGNDSFETEAYTFENNISHTVAGLQSAEIEEAAALAEALGGCRKLVIEDKTKWANISKSFKSCIDGKEVVRGTSSKIKKKECATFISQKFRITPSTVLCEQTIPTLGVGNIIKSPRDGKRIKIPAPASALKLKTSLGKEIMIPGEPKTLDR